jgi:hypothetical protein
VPGGYPGGTGPAIGYDPAMSDQDYYQQYHWALQRLRDAFGRENVTPRTPAEGGQVLAAVVRNPAAQNERPEYTLFLKDRLLFDLNKHANPYLALEEEVRSAQAYFEGKSPHAMTIP